MHTSPTILAIEDNLSIRRFLKTAIHSQGYEFLECGKGKEGLELAATKKPDVILLDLGLPDMDGLSVIREIRTWTATPIIVLSARDQENDKIVALDLGADDYLTKPFSVHELNARLRVALRHGIRINDNETPIFETDDLKIDLVNHCVWVNNKTVLLSPIQFSILATLVRNPNKVITHRELLKQIWGDNHVEDLDYLRIYIHQLRQKIETNPARPKYLKTEPGYGYRFISEMQK